MVIIYWHVFTYNLVIYLLIIVQELMNKSDHDLFCKLCASLTHALNHLLPPRVARSPVFYGRSPVAAPEGRNRVGFTALASVRQPNAEGVRTEAQQAPRRAPKARGSAEIEAPAEIDFGAFCH